jgi:beta-galactosidase
LPVGAVAETNPAARLDYARFASEQVVCYLRMQAEILRAQSPGRFITHNFMGFFTGFDHWQAGRDLDLASWDSYPLGFLERFPFSQDERSTLAETSHPDIAPFNHDLYRGVGNGRWWVMEQQPGPVNWAPWNPVPKPGMIRLWTWEALAHGAEVVSYFRWRQCPFAQEQMHAGLQRPDRKLSPGGAEATRVGEEIARMGALPESQPAPVALVFDYEAVWISRIQPQGADFNQVELCFRWYEAVRRLGLDVDILAPGADLSGYRMVLVPSLPIVSAAAEQALAGTRAKVLFGPRSGSKTAGFSIPERLPPGPLQQLIPMRVAQVASLRPGLAHSVSGPGIEGQVIRWREWVETEAEVLARFADRTPALLQAGDRHYLAGWPDSDLLRAVLARLLKGVPDLRTTELPPLVRLRRHGDLMFAFNYGDSPWTAPESNPAHYRLGGPVVGPQDVACWLFTPAVVN